MFMVLLQVALGGAIGSVLRFLTVASLGAPVATLIVNVVGSFLKGVVVASMLPYLGGSAVWRTFLATGILGGFTTFSAFSLDAMTLLEKQQFNLLAVYVVGSVVVSVLALAAGVGVVRVALNLDLK